MQYIMQWITDNASRHCIAPNNNIKEHRSHATQNTRQPSWYKQSVFTCNNYHSCNNHIYKSSQSQATHNLRSVLLVWRPVSTLNSVHHQAVTQEHEHKQKLKAKFWEISQTDAFSWRDLSNWRFQLEISQTDAFSLRDLSNWRFQLERSLELTLSVWEISRTDAFSFCLCFKCLCHGLMVNRVYGRNWLPH